MESRAIGVFATMAVAFGILLGGMYACTPEKAAAGTEVKASAIRQWETLRCHCNRRDARGCVHWQCRRP